MSASNPASTPIARSKTSALARILDSVPKGYIHYTAGECPVEKMEALARKFHERYGIGCSPAQRLIRKQKGLANAVLVLYCPAQMEVESTSLLGAEAPAGLEVHLASDERGTHTSEHAEDSAESASPSPAQPMVMPRGKVSWLLLATKGNGPIHEQEQLRSVLDSRRLVFLRYELVRYATRGKTSWTWRRTKEEMAELHALLEAQLKGHHLSAVHETLLRISRQPGFSRVREQSWALFQFARRWGYDKELPFLHFLQKVSHGERMWL